MFLSRCSSRQVSLSDPCVSFDVCLLVTHVLRYIEQTRYAKVTMKIDIDDDETKYLLKPAMVSKMNVM